MLSYSELIALSYFARKEKHYVLSELMKILGASIIQFDVTLDNLIDGGYIKYENTLLNVTDRGVIALVSNNMNDCDSCIDEDYNGLHLNPDASVSVVDPYVPDGFLQKI